MADLNKEFSACASEIGTMFPPVYAYLIERTAHPETTPAQKSECIGALSLLPHRPEHDIRTILDKHFPPLVR